MSYSYSARATLPLLFALCPALLFGHGSALANGGPIAAEDGPGGGVTPIQNKVVRLVREKLRIEVGKMGRHYEADARYVLENLGAPQTVNFGVPLIPHSAESGYRGGDEPIPFDAAKSVEVSLGGKTYRCEEVFGVTRFKKLRGDTWVSIYDEAWVEKNGPPPRPTYDDYLESDWGWCLMRLPIPRGKAIELRLRYKSELEYSDSDTNKSPFKGFSARKLRYALYPGGYWEGIPEKVDIEVDLGRLERFGEVVAPPGASKVDGKLVWSLKNVDLKRTRFLAVDLPAQEFLELEEYRRYSPSHIARFEIRASSQLKAQGKNSYGPANLLDHREHTAWCESRRGDGIGEWLEVEGQINSDYNHCQVNGFVIEPGYTKSQAAYRDNGRVTKIRLAPCGPGAAKNEPITESLRVPERFDQALQYLPVHGLEFGSFEKKGDEKMVACVRIIIEAVKAGKKYRDTCVSALVPVVMCY